MRRILRNSIIPLLLLVWHATSAQTVRIQPQYTSFTFISGAANECGPTKADPRIAGRFKVAGTDRTNEWRLDVNNVGNGHSQAPTTTTTATYDVAYGSAVQALISGAEEDSGVESCVFSPSGQQGVCGFTAAGSSITHSSIGPSDSYSSTTNADISGCTGGGSNNAYRGTWNYRWHYISGINAGTIATSGSTNVCPLYNPPAFTESVAPSAYNAGYEWFKRAAIETGNAWVTTGVTTATFDPGVVSETISYRRAIRFRTGFGANDFTWYNSNEITFTAYTQTNIAAITPNPATTCSTTPITLTQPGTLGTGASWQWDESDPFVAPYLQTSTSPTINVNPSTTTTYFVKAINSAICDGSYVVTSFGESVTTNRQVTVIVASTNPSSLSASPTTSCSGDPVTLTVVGGGLGTGASWALYTSNPTVGSPSPVETNATGIFNVSPTSTQQYWVRSINNSAPCTANGTAVTTTVTVNQPSTAPTSISGPSFFCEGSDSITLTAVGGTLGTGANYEWSEFSDFSVPISGYTGTTCKVKPSADQTYYVRINNTASPCTSTTTSASWDVEFRDTSLAPNPITGISTICEGSSTTLSVTGTLGTGAQFQWYSGSCGGTPITSGTSINVSPTSTTTYFVRAEGSCNTTACEEITVTVKDSSVAATAAILPPAVCLLGSNPVLPTITLADGSLGTDADWEWYDSPALTTNIGSGSPINLNPQTYPTVYVRAQIQDLASPCPLNSEVLEVDLSGIILDNDLNNDLASIVADQNPICDNGSVELTTSSASFNGSAQYMLYNADPLLPSVPVDSNTSGVFNVSLSTTTTYYITTKNTCNETVGENLEVVVNYSSVAPTGINADVTTICNDGDQAIITATGGTLGTDAEYQWATTSDFSGGILAGEITNSITVSPTDTTTYYVRIINTASPCTDVSGTVQNIKINVNQPSVAPTAATPDISTICNGANTDVTIVANGTLGSDAEYQWATTNDFSGGILVGENTNTVVVSPTATTTYYVRIISTASPCTDVSSVFASTTITVNEPSTAPTGINADVNPICNDGDQTTITTTGGVLGTGAEYQWATSSDFSSGILAGETTNEVTVSPTATTTYYVRIINTASPCSDVSGDVQNITIDVNQPSVAPTTATPDIASICNGEATDVTIVANGTLGTDAEYEWATSSDFTTGILVGETTNTIVVSPTSTTTYYVRIVNTASPCNDVSGSSASTTITVNEPSTAPTGISADVNPICNDGDQVTITATGGVLGTDAEYQWATDVLFTNIISGETTNEITVTPTTTTTYYVRIVNTASPCSDVSGTSQNIEIEVKQPSTAPSNATPDNATICNGSNVTITADGVLGDGAVYEWSVNSDFSSPFAETGNVLVDAPTVTTTYYVRIINTDAPCNDVSASFASVTITVNEESFAPDLILSDDIDADDVICNGTPITITAYNGVLGTDAEYEWATSSDFSSGILVGENTDAITVTPTATTTYYVHIINTASPCTDISGDILSLTVTVKQPSVAPTVITPDFTTICNGDQVELTANGTLGDGAEYLWATDPGFGNIVGNNTNTIQDFPTATTTYYVKIVNTEAPCDDVSNDYAEIEITVNEPSVDPTSLTADISPICNGDNTDVTLTTDNGTLGTGASWYLYDTDPTVGSPTAIDNNATGEFVVSPTTTTTYFVRSEGTASPCAAIGTAVSTTVTVNQPSTDPTSITSDLSLICANDPIELTVNGGSLGTDAEWVLYDGDPDLGGSVVSSNSTGVFNINPTATTTYYVRAEGTATPCASNTNSVSVSITVDDVSTPASSLSAASTTICGGETTTLTTISGSLGAGAEWYLYDTDPTIGSPTPIDNNNTGEFNVSPTVTTTYYVRAENFCGVTTAVSETVVVNGGDNTNSPIVASSATSTCVVTDNNWHYFMDNNGDIIAAVNSNGQDLGNVTWSVNVGPIGPFTSTASSCTMGEYHVERIFSISCDNQPSSPINVKLFFTAAEYAAHKAVSDLQDGAYIECFGTTSSAADLVVSAIFPDGQGEGFVPSRGLFSGPNGSHDFEVVLDPSTPLTGSTTQNGRFDNSGTDLYIHNNGGRSSILPVELTSFTAAPSNGGVQLAWTTASEKNNDRFDVLRSTDGVNFVKIGEVDGNGTTSVPQAYSFFDNTVASGVYYYQLRQVDFDGANELSKIVSVELSASTAFTAGNFFPNPTNSTTSLIVNMPTDGKVVFSLYTTDGRQVYNQVYNLGKGQQRVDFDFNLLPAGTYIGSIQTENEVITKKLSIQR